MPFERAVGEQLHGRVHAYAHLCRRYWRPRRVPALAKTDTLLRRFGDLAGLGVSRFAEVFCTARTSDDASDGYASWPLVAAAATPVNVSASACQEGYIGTPTRTCNSDGTWGAVVNPCSGTIEHGGPARRPAAAARSARERQ